jgi:serine/threonine-protein kinase HipA
MKTAPVWAWLEGSVTPVRVGILSRDEHTGAGTFQYDAGYLSVGGRALDPGQLRHRDAKRPITIRAADREGVPGIIADAGPDAWGRRVLAQDLGYEPDAMDALVHSADDGAGNLAVGDLDAKPPIEWLDLLELAEAIRRRQEGQAPKDRRLTDQVLSPDTALGGAKPKASILVDGFPWIAKFPEHGDPLNLPYYEAAALRMAKRLGIDSATVEVQSLPHGRSVLLVKRFDRLPNGARIPVASGLTVLGPAAQVISPARSYLRLAQALKTWTHEDKPYPASAEIWERLVYNALVGNGDDHPRNHALLYSKGAWQLSPVFDVVPTFLHRDKVALAMPFLSLSPTKVTASVSAINLVRAAPAYGVPVDKAQNRLVEMARGIQAVWPDVLAEIKAPGEVARETQPVLDWSARLLAEAQALTASDLMTGKPKRLGWRWAP